MYINVTFIFPNFSKYPFISNKRLHFITLTSCIIYSSQTQNVWQRELILFFLKILVVINIKRVSIIFTESLTIKFFYLPVSMCICVCMPTLKICYHVCIIGRIKTFHIICTSYRKNF